MELDQISQDRSSIAKDEILILLTYCSEIFAIFVTCLFDSALILHIVLCFVNKRGAKKKLKMSKQASELFSTKTPLSYYATFLYYVTLPLRPQTEATVELPDHQAWLFSDLAAPFIATFERPLVKGGCRRYLSGILIRHIGTRHVLFSECCYS